jgi:hypothetical protein
MACVCPLCDKPQVSRRKLVEHLGLAHKVVFDLAPSGAIDASLAVCRPSMPEFHPTVSPLQCPVCLSMEAYLMRHLVEKHLSLLVLSGAKVAIEAGE